MSTLVVIPARGGSKGVPGKNLADLGGKPLVVHAVERALVALRGWETGQVVVSTDSPDIQAVSVAAGAACPSLRPAELAGDLVPSLPVVQHAVRDAESVAGHRFSTVVLVQATAPLWRPADLRACLEGLKKDDAWASAVLVTTVQTHPFKMKRLLDDGRLINLIDQGFEDMRPRQVLPPVFRRAGSVYASRREVVMDSASLVGDPCLGIEVPPETAVDIDTPLDLALVRMLHEQSGMGS